MLVTEHNITESLGHTEGFLAVAFMIDDSFYLGTVGKLQKNHYPFDTLGVLNINS